MGWFLNIKTQSKLMISFGLLLILLTIVISTAYCSISSLQKSQQVLFDQGFTTSVSLKGLLIDINDVRAGMSMMMLINNQDDMVNKSGQVNAFFQDAATLIPLIQSQLQATPARAVEFEAAVNLISAYRATIENQVIPLIKAGKLDEAINLYTGLQRDRYEQIRAIVNQVGNDEVNLAKLQLAQSEKASRQYLWLFGIIGGIALFLALFVMI